LPRLKRHTVINKNSPPKTTFEGSFYYFVCYGQSTFNQCFASHPTMRAIRQSQSRTFQYGLY
ncbi:MAG: hypothetical protein ACOYLC_13135, partial [Armatimonadaceae bacterium]